MSTRGSTARTIGLGTVQRRFARWREQRPRLMPIPDTLWQAAAALYPTLCVHRIATALHLDGSALKKHLAPSPAALRKRVPARQGFLDLTAEISPTGGHYLLEVQGSDGTTVRVRNPGSWGVADVVEAVRGILERRG